MAAIAFLGLGNMGGPMAKNLLAAGHSLTVFDLVEAACAALETDPNDRAFYEAKLTTGQYYMARHLPATALHLARITSGGDTVMALDAEAFSG